MFSIVVPARIFSSVLKNTLEKILLQKYQNFEVLVVLDFEAKDLLINEKIIYLFSGIKSPGEKRNLGIENAKGEFIAFLDDDAYPDCDWLHQAKTIFDTFPDYIGVCGPSITPPESSFLEQIGGYVYESFLTSGPTIYRHKPLKHRLVDDYPTVNLIIKKDKITKIGGFDSKFWPGEDTKFCLDLTLEFGKSIYYSPNLKVNHFRRNVFHPHLIQISRYAFHRGFFAKKFPQTSFKLSYFIPSIFLIYVVLLPFVYFFSSYPWKSLVLAPLFFYTLIMIYDLYLIYNKSNSIGATILSSIGIISSNLTYGIFFIKGLFGTPELVLREVDFLNEKYLKG